MWRILLVVLLLGVCALGQAAQPVQVALRQHHGRPTVFLDGKPNPLPTYMPIAFAKYLFVKAMPRFYPHKMGCYYICPVQAPNEDFFGSQFWVGDQISNQPLIPTPKTNFTGMDESAEMIRQSDPDAYLMVSFGLHEPMSWAKLHQDQYFVTETGKIGSAPSLASDLYWDAAARYATALVQYCESRPWGARVIGYTTWYHTEGVHMPVIEGWMFDRSPMMTARWRAFLQEKYGTVERLRAAHGDKTLTFETVEVPKDKLRGATPEVAAQLYWQAAKDHQPLRDYLLLQRDLFHHRFRQICTAMQGGANRKVLITIDAMKQIMQGWNCGDYFVETAPRSLAEPELMAGSGSMQVASLMDTAPGFDGLNTPLDYQARGIGGTFEPEGIVDSIVLRGKYFQAQMDLRTYKDTPKHPLYGRARDDREFAAISWRNIAGALTRGCNPYWMDLSADWFSTEAIHQVIQRQVEVLKESVNWPHETVPGIAMIIDDTAALETNGMGNIMQETVMWEQKMGMARCGVPYRIYLLEDLALPNFPKHRVYYFPNLYRVDEATLALLQKSVLRDGNVVVWGPGSGISDGTTIGPESASKLTGFTFRYVAANYPRRTLLSNFTHPITRGMREDTMIGSAVSYGPLLFPTDGEPLGLAWTKNGEMVPGLAAKTFGKGARGAYLGKEALGAGDYAAVFTSAAPLPADLWRGLARYGGAHIYSTTNDVLMADNTIVALHSLASGEKRLTLPGTFRVFDVITGKQVAKKAREITFTLTGPDTRVFRLEPVR